MSRWLLQIGSRQSGFFVCPDETYPTMWRIHAPDGRISDMVNLSRAKDAAIAWAKPRGLGGTEIARWSYRETSSGGARRRQSS